MVADSALRRRPLFPFLPRPCALAYRVRFGRPLKSSLELSELALRLPTLHPILQKRVLHLRGAPLRDAVDAVLVVGWLGRIACGR
jgi:hypothetical protein